MAQHFAKYSDGQMPLIPCSDALDMETLRQLSNHRLDQTPFPHQRLNVFLGTVVLHITTQWCL